MTKTLCPVCSSRFRMKGQPRLRRPFVCPHCRTELLVHSVEPLSFIWDEMRAGSKSDAPLGAKANTSWDDGQRKPGEKKRPPKPLRPAPPPWQSASDESDDDED